MRTFYSPFDEDMDADARLVDLLWGATNLLDLMNDDEESCVEEELSPLGADAWVQYSN